MPFETIHSHKRFYDKNNIIIPPKNILILHNTYQEAGGEDAVVKKEEALLRAYKHDVHLYSVSNHTIKGFWGKVKIAWRTPYSGWGREKTLKVIEKIKPDLVHVHNFFPKLSPAIYDACRDARVPVVQTLHNYRIICPGGLLLREGKPCEDCIQGSPYQAVLHKCYRQSRVGSLAVARMVDIHRRQRTWAVKVDRFIALTEFSRSKFVEAGIPFEKIAVKPNFVEAVDSETTVESDRKGALFVGRLSPEKGVDTLLRAWKELDVPLRIIGNGSMSDRVRVNVDKHVHALGKKGSMQVAEEMGRAAFLVVPSECYENFPVTLVEAFSQGLPVIASRLGAMAEVIEDSVTGLHFTPGDAKDLAKKVRWANEHPKEMRLMGRNARRVYEEKYIPEINHRRLMDIYKKAIEAHGQLN